MSRLIPNLRSNLTAFLLLGLIGPGLTLGSDGPGSSSGIEFFEAKIRPVFVERCAKCHSSGTKAAKGGLKLDGAAAIRLGGESGPMLGEGEPGHFKAEDSTLISALSHGGEIAAMPPDAKLADRILADFREWVEMGAPMPEFTPAGANPSTAPLEAKVKAGIDFEAGRRFWSFVEATERPAPPVSNPAWSKTRIDPFVLSTLDAQKMAPSPMADRRTMIRRLSFDLTVCRLRRTRSRRSSPTIRQRRTISWWITFSLRRDTASAGGDSGSTSLATLKITPPRRRPTSAAECPRLPRLGDQCAINDDLPYNEFIRRQLAADLEPGLPPSRGRRDRLSRPRSGLSQGTKALGRGHRRDRRRRVGRAARHRHPGLLGLTVACARCHDHKFDPIGTADYYALAGVIASTQLVDRSLEPTDAETAEGPRREPEDLDRPRAATRLRQGAKGGCSEGQGRCRQGSKIG